MADLKDTVKLVKDSRKRHTALLNDRENYQGDWEDLAEYFAPTQVYMLRERDQREKRLHLSETKLMDDTSVRAVRVLSAGMMGGMTSPARPWFRLGLVDPTLENEPGVKEWLHQVQKLMLDLFSRSNFYSSMHSLYEDLGVFGQGVLFVDDDEETLAKFTPVSIGTYCLAAGANGQVDTMYRLFEMSATQLVGMFGKDKVSTRVLEAFEDQARQDDYFSVVHAVFPNKDYDPEIIGVGGKKFISLYYEYVEDQSDGPQEPLRLKGYTEQPFVAPRWSVVGDEVYGRSPGQDTYHDARSLQSLEVAVYKGIHKLVDPPMVADENMIDVDLTPGAVNAAVDPTKGLQPAMRVAIDVSGTMVLIERKKNDIEVGLYNDLLKMFTSLTKTMTATEVQERAEERLLQLGPVIERLHSELHDLLISRVFGILSRSKDSQGNPILPEPPQVLQGTVFGVEYISILAQAQKLVGTNSLQNLIFFIGNVAQLNQEALDALNIDEAVDEYSEMLGASPMILRPLVERQEIRQRREAAQAEAIQTERQAQAIDGADKMANAALSSSEAVATLSGSGGTGV